jgi:hypothetical protein
MHGVVRCESCSRPRHLVVWCLLIQMSVRVEVVTSSGPWEGPEVRRNITSSQSVFAHQRKNLRTHKKKWPHKKIPSHAQRHSSGIKELFLQFRSLSDSSLSLIRISLPRHIAKWLSIMGGTRVPLSF